jgi:tRNA(His) 5'-end guanylyltransferase
MKGYEVQARTTLLRRTPVILRVDGKAFHTFTKQFTDRDPYSEVMAQCMAETAVALVSEIQNAVFAYTQSDEISVLIADWKKLNTDAWFGNQVQKMTSVAGAIATRAFIQAMMRIDLNMVTSEGQALPLFDARVFNLPVAEVVNYFIWRQQDATRNSINMLGQHYFSHRELQGMNVTNVQDMLMTVHDVNWNDVPVRFKRGQCVVPGCLTGKSVIDDQPPIFTQDREYVSSRMEFENS